MSKVKSITRLIYWLLPVSLSLLTVSAFLPSLQNGFVEWDDDLTFLENPHYRGLGWTQLYWMFTTFHTGHYQPLTWMTWGMDYLLWGLDPFGYHLTNLLLHAANAVVFYFLALRLLSLALRSTESRKDLALTASAGFAALLFALHPLRVESVAWATERRDVLSALFYLLTILCYLRAAALAADGRRRLSWLLASLLLYTMSLLSKASGITLPIVLVVLDVYPLRRIGSGAESRFGAANRWVWFEKIPFLLLALAAGSIAAAAQHKAGAMETLLDYGVAQRLAQVAFGLAFYLYKTILPLRLSPLYEIPSSFDPWDWPFLLSAAIVIAISLGLFFVRNRRPALLAGWICYIVVAAPVLGVLQSGPQFAADRYTYLSCLPWAMLASGAILFWWRRLNGHAGRMISVLAGGLAVAVALGVATWRQTQVWHDTERLWRYVLAVTEDSRFPSSIAHYNLARFLTKRDRLEEAVEHYRRSLGIEPARAIAHNNLGNLLAKLGHLDEAKNHLREATRILPHYAEAYNNLGNIAAIGGDFGDAILHYRRTLELNPALIDTRFNLALALTKEQRVEEAGEEFQKLVDAQPDFAAARYYLGNILLAQGQIEKGVEQLEEAVRLQPEFVAPHEVLGKILGLLGRRDEAIRHYEEALRILKTQKPEQPPS
ncbi:MAG TPA: tetratricopeptide repeat protein [Candidatus Binatia bacterium]|jgi:tetratricopeptide (TPR) repeat protein